MVNGIQSGSVGLFHQIPPLKKKKRFASFARDKAFLTLCGTTLGCRTLAGCGRSQPAAQADGITPVTRPRLLASSFSRRLQGDFHAPFLSAFHRHGGSLCRLRCATRPYLRHCIRLPEHHIMFCRFVNCCGEIFPVFPGRSPSHSATSVSTAWRSVWAPPTFPGKIT